MMRKVISCILVAIMYLCSPIISMSEVLAATTTPNNIALCYHGIVTNESEKSQYMTYIEDFKGQIDYIKSKGYTFVSPSKYNRWYTKKYTPTTPIATIMFDDARESVDIAANWLIENKIPFGIAVIGRKLRTVESEDGYMNWSTLNGIMNTGYCEILSHSYNMHHFGLYYENSSVVSAPILEGPCYLDSGDFLYVSKDDPRWYWDLSLVDDVSWAFPLLGTDITTGTPITSTVEFKATESITANKLRVWASLHSPYSSGYDANVIIDINGTQVANKTINVVQYETRSQWPEREFVTIDFDSSYSIEANKTYTITFTTQNTGDSAFNIYSIPDFSGDYALSTTCEGMTYGAQDKWPAQACMIIAGDNGKQATDADYELYVSNDLSMNNTVIKNYLSATWNVSSTGFAEDENLECVVLGGTYSDGSLANTNIKFTPTGSFTGEALRFKSPSHIGNWYPMIVDIYINDKKVAGFSPNWQDWSWQTVNITPYEFVSGQEYNITFKTANESPNGYGLVRILTDQQILPWPVWDEATGSWIKPSESQFQHDVRYEVNSLEGTDVYPDDVIIDNLEYAWNYTAPYTGPGKTFLEILSYVPGTSTAPKQICFPFGSYYAKANSTKQGVNPVLKTVLQSISLKSGYAVWDEGITNMGDIQSQYNKHVIPRYLVEGNIEQSQILKNIDTLIGIQ